MSAGSRQLVLRLECGGACVKECAVADLPAETRIGRAGDCFWRIPDSDKSASSHHAVLRKKGRKVVIVDTDSRNGIYFKGVSVKERKIAAGDIIGIGDAKLVAEFVTVGSGLAAEFHTLEQLGGEEKGRTIALDRPVTRIGSGRECEVRIADSLVSHVHVLFEVRSDGYCYVKDNASRNGIKINGVRQSEEAALTGQMLKDGDIVSVAYVDFRFWDRTVQHVRANLAQKVLIVVATLAIALGGYFGVQTFFPSAKTMRLRAERMAANGNFAEAEKLAQQSVEARGADLDAVQRGELLRKLALWERTARGWKEIKEALSKEDVNLWRVNGQFAALIFSDNENWKWNTSDALVEMSHAKATQAMLTKYLSGVERLGKVDIARDALAALAADAEAVLSATADETQPYQASIRMRLADLAEEMRRVVAEADGIKQIMDGYSSIEGTDLAVDAIAKIAAGAAQRIESRKKEGKPVSPRTGQACHLRATPLAELQKSLRCLEANYRAVAATAFADFQASLPVPEVDACMVEPNLTTRRAEILAENDLLAKAIVQLKSFRRYLESEKMLVEDGTLPPVFSGIFDPAVRSRALGCDCLSKPPPSYSTKEPTSDYDRVMGVNVFYSYLASADGEFDSSVLDERFAPDVFKATAAFKTLVQFVSFCDPEGKTRYAPIMRKVFAAKTETPRLGKEVRAVKALLRRRDALLQELDGLVAKDGSSRQGVLAAGLALCLREGMLSAADEEKARAAIATSFKAIRRKTSETLRASDGKTPEARIAAERAALSVGIPGDPLVRQPWADQTKGMTR